MKFVAGDRRADHVANRCPDEVLQPPPPRPDIPPNRARQAAPASAAANMAIDRPRLCLTDPPRPADLEAPLRSSVPRRHTEYTQMKTMTKVQGPMVRRISFRASPALCSSGKAGASLVQLLLLFATTREMSLSRSSFGVSHSTTSRRLPAGTKWTLPHLKFLCRQTCHTSLCAPPGRTPR